MQLKSETIADAQRNSARERKGYVYEYKHKKQRKTV